MDASDDHRVVDIADKSGIDFAYRRHGPDQGQAAAIAEGWRNTTGKYLGWLNADDVLFPSALHCAAEAFSSTDAPDVLYGDSTILNYDGATIGVHGQIFEVSSSIFRSNPISQPSCFFRRDLVERIGGLDESLHYTMDWDLWVRLYEAGAKFQKSERYLSAVYCGNGTKTSQLSMERLREIILLMSDRVTFFDQCKSLTGFALHHFYRMPSYPNKFIKNGDQSKRTLPILNTSDEYLETMETSPFIAPRNSGLSRSAQGQIDHWLLDVQVPPNQFVEVLVPPNRVSHFFANLVRNKKHSHQG